MSADLYIHIRTEKQTEEDFKCFFHNSLGSKYFSWDKNPCEEQRDKILDTFSSFALDEWHKIYPNESVPKFSMDDPKYKKWQEIWQKHLGEFYKENGHSCEHYEKISQTENVWVGEVSWLKAALFEDSDTFVPDPIEKIVELIGENFPVIDDKFIEEIKKAMELPNNTAKKDGVWGGKGYSLAGAEKILEFLNKWKGYSCFTISW